MPTKSRVTVYLKVYNLITTNTGATTLRKTWKEEV